MSHKLRDLSDAELLAGVGDIAPRDESQLQDWLDYEELQPGTARVSSRDLYAAYIMWTDQHPDRYSKILHQTVIGAELTRRFKRTKGKNTNFYFVRWGLRNMGRVATRVNGK